MGREKQRARAERMTAQLYFTYAGNSNRFSYSWVPQYMRTMKIAEVLCPECDYVPRPDSTQPRRAFKAHVKKYHALLYSQKYMKPYVIHEEPDFEREFVNA
jgi:hypothetical protein